MAIAEEILKPDEAGLLSAARKGDQDAFGELAGRYLRELRAHCYRMTGSLHDAEDAAQEALLKAWRGMAAFDGRSSLRMRLYTIATNVCLDSLKHSSRRVLPSSLVPAADPSAPPKPFVTEPIWLEPFPDALLPDTESNPEARYTTRERVELAFMVAIQRLAPKQWAVLLLREVMGWNARNTTKGVRLKKRCRAAEATGTDDLLDESMVAPFGQKSFEDLRLQLDLSKGFDRSVRDRDEPRHVWLHNLIPEARVEPHPR